MQATLEKGLPVLETGGDNNNIDPPIETAQRNGDGEGDGRFIAAGIDVAESYANGGFSVEISGADLVDMVYGATRRTVLRNKVSVSAGRMATGGVGPTFSS